MLERFAKLILALSLLFFLIGITGCLLLRLYYYFQFQGATP